MPALKTVAVFYSVPEAQIARAFLESHGIQALVPDSHTATNLSYMTPLMGGVRVAVPEDQLEVAQKLLRGQQDFRLVETDDGAQGDPHFELVAKSESLAEAPAPRDESTFALAALNQALKTSVFGLIIPLVPTVLSFFFLGRYLKHRDTSPLSKHFWLVLSINVLCLAMCAYLMHALRGTNSL